MNKNLENKKNIVNKIENEIANSKGIYLFDYHGLSAPAFNKVKIDNMDKGIKFSVYKNTLAKIAFKNKNFEKINENLIGPTAFVFAKENELLPGKVLSMLGKENKKIKTKSAIIDNTILSFDEIKQLSRYESKKDIITAIAGSLNFPINRLLLTLQAVAKKIGE